VLCNCSSTLINFSNLALTSLIIPSFSFKVPSNTTFLLDSLSKFSFNLATIPSNSFFSFINIASLTFTLSNATVTSFNFSNSNFISPIKESFFFKRCSNSKFILDSTSNSFAKRSRCAASWSCASCASRALSSALAMDS